MRGFVQAQTRPQTLALLPELAVLQAHEMLPLWQLTEVELSASGLPPPFWAFAWAGGQALARYILDHPATVMGRTVVDFASGSGLVGIAAAKSGAARVVCTDIDPLARIACSLNAALNDVSIEMSDTNWLETQPLVPDVVLAGDVFYEQPMSNDISAWLGICNRQGVHVLVGDPGRTHLPRTQLRLLATYTVTTTRELEDSDLRRTQVFEFDQGRRRFDGACA
jgi:predicted nicotinamide N-methyase